MKKCCFKCGESKPIEEFYKHPTMADGHLGKCKECTKNDSNKHRAENLESCHAYDRERANLPHRVELRKKVTKTWIEDGQHSTSVERYREKHPDRYHAHNTVRNALRNGTLKRETVCSRCGMETESIHAHHSDYAIPLGIEWLCVECHGRAHQKYSKPQTKEIVSMQSVLT